MSYQGDHRVPPYDAEIEQVVLGSMMKNVQYAEFLSQALVPDDFYVPAHQRAFECFVALVEAGQLPSPTSARPWFDAHPDPAVPLAPSDLRGYADMGTYVGVHRLAETIASHSLRRKAIKGGLNLAEAGYDLTLGVEGLTSLAGTVASDLALPAGKVEAGPGVDEFLGSADEPFDWVIPGMLERQHRVLLTGWKEAGGKTTLARQWAVQAAAGLRWFSTATEMPPLRVLFVDCENPPALTRRKFRSLRITAAEALEDEMRLVIKCRPEGLDLLHARDQQWLAGLCEANRPDLVFIGPLYKLHDGDPTEERPAKALAVYFDHLRVRYDCALVIEAHPPNEAQGFKRPLRPYGASLWRRWPEIGLGLDEVDNEYVLQHWKMRDDYAWPNKLRRGGAWPWQTALGEFHQGSRAN